MLYILFVLYLSKNHQLKTKNQLSLPVYANLVFYLKTENYYLTINTASITVNQKPILLITYHYISFQCYPLLYTVYYFYHCETSFYH